MDQQISLHKTTTSHSDEARKQAVRNVFAAMSADFGSKFLRQFDPSATETAIKPAAWMRRLYARIGSSDVEAIIDGYDAATKDRAPYMPNLVEIATAVLAANSARIRAREEASKIEGPNFTGGIAGYVEHVLAPSAETKTAVDHIDEIRRIVERKAGQPERLQEAVTRHDLLLVEAYKAGHIRPGPNVAGFDRCASIGCRRAGAQSHDIRGAGPWYCREHWRASQ